MPIYYHLSSERLPLSIESIGNHWHQEKVRRSNGYPYYHWLQTETGSGTVVSKQQTIRLKENQGMLIPPFTPHVYFPDTAKHWHTCFVTFNGTLAESIHLIVGDADHITAENQTSFSFSHWIEHYVALFDTNTPVDPDALSVDCFRFLSQLAALSGYGVQNAEKHPLFTAYVEPALAYIADNYAHDIAVSSLAKRLFVSPQYLTRLFNRFLGLSTSRYLVQYRLKKAKELLVNHPYLDIKTIAFRTGFNDVSHFVATFRRETGYTPLSFKKLYNNQ